MKESRQRTVFSRPSQRPCGKTGCSHEFTTFPPLSSRDPFPIRRFGGERRLARISGGSPGRRGPPAGTAGRIFPLPSRGSARQPGAARAIALPPDGPAADPAGAGGIPTSSRAAAYPPLRGCRRADTGLRPRRAQPLHGPRDPL